MTAFATIFFLFLLHLNGLYMRLTYRCFHYLFLGYYQRLVYEIISTRIPCVRINDDVDDDDDDDDDDE